MPGQPGAETAHETAEYPPPGQLNVAYWYSGNDPVKKVNKQK
jgi:hypothetical protein